MDLAELYRTHGEAVLRRCRRLSGTEDEARDLLQEAFLRAHKYRHSYRGGSQIAWLLTIADRVAFTAAKRAKRLPVSEVEVGEFSTLSEVPAALRRTLVRKLLGRTSERTAMIVIRRYFDEMTLEQTADELGLNERTVRRHLDAFVEEARAFVDRKETGHG